MLAFLLFILSAGLLLVILVQDIRERAVNVFAFPLLWGCLAVSGILNQSVSVVLEAWTMNVLFLAVQVVALYVYFIFTRRRMVAVIGTALGLGDVLFWLTAAVFFSLPNYLFFFLGSLLVSLFLHFTFRVWQMRAYCKTVPLAGFQALVLLIVLVVRQFYPQIDLYSDSFILELLM